MNLWLSQLTQFFAPYFVNPMYVAGGAALIASPIIIHLINRMRYRRVRFAAMEFLLSSQKRNRRRILFEQLLLLLLRILIVLALVALIARLILDPSQLSIFEGAKAHHVVLLDDSGSMQDRWGETTAFQEAQSVIRKLVAEGARRPQTQTFSLILLSRPDEEYIPQTDVDDRLVTQLESRLENLRCTHRSLDLVQGLEAAGKLLAEDVAMMKHLHVLSDFRKHNWESGGAIGSTIKKLDDAGVAVTLLKTVPERHANLAITDLSGDLSVAAAGIPVRLHVTVTNFGDKDVRDVRLSILQDGRKQPRSIPFDQIKAGEAASTSFDVTFDTPGRHDLQVGLEADALAQDNTRYLAVHIPEANPVLVIDGNPEADEALYLTDALGQTELTGFSTVIESVDFLRKQPLERFQSVFLLNVASLPPDAVAPLERYARDGGGLAWFLGDVVQPAFYTDKLYLEGKGLFPVPLAPALGDLPPDSGSEADLIFEEHPVFSIFSGQDNPFSELVDVYNYIPVAEEWERDDQRRGDSVTTIATLRNREPVMFEHQLGDGRIITCLTSAGPMWNNWASGTGKPSYVITLLEMQKYLAKSDSTIERRVVGEPIRVVLDPAKYTETVRITAPDVTGERTTELVAAPEANEPGGDDQQESASETNAQDVRLVATYRDTETPGVYRVEFASQDEGAQQQWLSYNVPADESNLSLASTAEIRKRLGDGVQVTIQEYGTAEDIFVGKDIGQEVRNVLLLLLLGLFVAEQALAYRLSYHPSTAATG